MSWEEIVKVKLNNPHLVERAKRALYEQEGRIPPKSQQAISTKPCEVRKCSAVSCVNNSDFKCTLPEITINPKGACEQFKEFLGSGSLEELHDKLLED